MTTVDGGAEQLIGGVIIKIALFDLADVAVQWLQVRSNEEATQSPGKNTALYISAKLAYLQYISFQSHIRLTEMHNDTF